MIIEKYALLYTDFISKTHLIRKDEQNKFLDLIMQMRGYYFYCHEQIKVELARHNIGNSYAWLEGKIGVGTIHCISDEEILADLRKFYSDSAEAMYASMLRNGCEAYENGFFEKHFPRLCELDYSEISSEAFLQELKSDCDDIGEGNNLGEIKSYVLLQMLNAKLGEQIYVFCSDDKNARNGIVSLGGARCISVLTAFMRLNSEGILTKEDAEPYIQSYLTECKKHQQTTFKVCVSKDKMRTIKVPCEQVMEEIYDGKLEALQNGTLRYINKEQ